MIMAIDESLINKDDLMNKINKYLKQTFIF